MNPAPLLLRQLGPTDYEATWRAMQRLTNSRNGASADELWLTEHLPVFTLGQAGKPEHLLHDIGIPLLKIDRGGQITYHGPGQVVLYVLLDLARRRIKVRELVSLLERAVIELLAEQGIKGERRDKAPGVYVEGAKIAALGLRVRNGCCYHGLSLNVDMDLGPYAAINPCGYPGLTVTQTRDLGVTASPRQVGEALAARLAALIEQG